MAKKKPKSNKPKKATRAQKKAAFQKKDAAYQRAVKKTAAQRPPVETSTAPISEPRISSPRTEPTGNVQYFEEIDPNVRKRFAKEFKERQEAEIGKELPIETQKRYSEDIQEMTPKGSEENPEGAREAVSLSDIKTEITPKKAKGFAVSGTGEVSPTRISKEKAPTDKERRDVLRKQGSRKPRLSGRGAGLPRGTGASIFTGGEVATPSPLPTFESTSMIRRTQKGEKLSDLPKETINLAIYHAKKDWKLAKETGRTINDIEPDDPEPNEVSIRGSHHERLAELRHAYGVDEDTLRAKLPGTGTFSDKVHTAWLVHRNDKRAKGAGQEDENKYVVDHKGLKVTHFIPINNPSGAAVPIPETDAEGKPVQFKRSRGTQEYVVKLPNDDGWKMVPPEHREPQGWKPVISSDASGKEVRALRYVPHVSERPEYQGMEIRSLGEHLALHVLDKVAPVAAISPSTKARQEMAEKVRKRFIEKRPEISEQGMFSEVYKPSNITASGSMAVPIKEATTSGPTLKTVPTRDVLMFPEPRAVPELPRAKDIETGATLPFPYTVNPETAEAKVRPLTKVSKEHPGVPVESHNARGVVTQPTTVPSVRSVDSMMAEEHATLADLEENIEKAAKLPADYKEKITITDERGRKQKVTLTRQDKIRQAREQREITGRRYAQRRAQTGVGTQLEKMTPQALTESRTGPKVGTTGEILRSREGLVDQQLPMDFSTYRSGKGQIVTNRNIEIYHDPKYNVPTPRSAEMGGGASPSMQIKARRMGKVTESLSRPHITTVSETKEPRGGIPELLPHQLPGPETILTVKDEADYIKQNKGYSYQKGPQKRSKAAYAGTILEGVDRKGDLARKTTRRVDKETDDKGQVVYKTKVFRGAPDQLELPGLESPGYPGAVGMQFRALTEKEAALEDVKSQGAIEGATVDRRTATRKSTRSFKGRR